jgi:hypothetical protein
MGAAVDLKREFSFLEGHGFKPSCCALPTLYLSHGCAYSAFYKYRAGLFSPGAPSDQLQNCVRRLW